MNSRNEYTEVKCLVKFASRDAVLVNHGTWIPFSLIHSADEKKIKRCMRGSTLTFRVMEWKAREL